MVEVIRALESETLLPSCLGHLILSQCGLGSYGERNNKSSTYWSKVVEPRSKVCGSLLRA